MKKYLCTIISITFILSAYSCSINNSIKGNRNIANKEFIISDYHTINLYGSGSIIYEQKSSSEPYLTVEIDNNLVEYLDIEVENGSLNVKNKNSTNINPSKYVIRTNSKEIQGLQVLGSGDINTVNTMKSEKELILTVKGSGSIKVPSFVTESLETHIQGSGNITAKGESINAELNVKGSGNIKIHELNSNSVKANISGSGNIHLGGKSLHAEYTVMGSGSIKGKELSTDTATCEIKGSGNIAVNVKEKLTNTINASGSINFIGNPPIVESSVKGSGSVNKRD